MSTGTIIIAAHNEQAVIGRTLDALADLIDSRDARVIVVCNGCTDSTADVASNYAVEVYELDVASKAAALREGDRRSTTGPRIYLDADVVLTSNAARTVISRLAHGAIAGRPPHVFDSRRATWIVRGWYRIREQLPSIATALWGAGCYALSLEGRQRFDEFPDLVSDDLYIHSLFHAAEIEIIDTEPVVVTTPRRTADLVRILQRSYRTQDEVSDVESGLSSGQRGQLTDLAALIRRDPRRLGDAIVYVAVIAYARIRTRFGQGSARWERDESSRELS